MTGSALSEEALLASLHDIRLPADAAGGVMADVALAVGAGALTAVLLLALWRMVSRASDPGRAPPAARFADLPEADRRIALLHHLRARAPDRYAALRPRLYRVEGGVDLRTLEREVADLD